MEIDRNQCRGYGGRWLGPSLFSSVALYPLENALPAYFIHAADATCCVRLDRYEDFTLD